MRSQRRARSQRLKRLPGGRQALPGGAGRDSRCGGALGSGLLGPNPTALRGDRGDGRGYLRAMRLADLALSPLYLAQALRFIARTERLPEAAGPREGQIGQGPGLRLLILGDSSGAGVGVAHQDQALVGQMLRHLAPVVPVQWQVIARSGATTARARRMLHGAGAFDIAVLALGVNDVLRQTSAHRFARQQAALMADLRARHGVQHILASAVPPFGGFTALPDPLRGYLHGRATRLDAVLRGVCAQAGACHVPFDLAPDMAWLARDGLHPGPALYAEWGQRMAGLALARLS